MQQSIRFEKEVIDRKENPHKQRDITQNHATVMYNAIANCAASRPTTRTYCELHYIISLLPSRCSYPMRSFSAINLLSANALHIICVAIATGNEEEKEEGKKNNNARIMPSRDITLRQ